MFTKVSGADGKVSRAKVNDRSGEVTLTLKATSPSNDYLAAAALADELLNEGVKTLGISDTSGRLVIFSATAWIRKQPSVEFGKEVGDRDWVFDCADLDMYIGGNPTSDGDV